MTLKPWGCPAGAAEKLCFRGAERRNGFPVAGASALRKTDKPDHPVQGCHHRGQPCGHECHAVKAGAARMHQVGKKSPRPAKGGHTGGAGYGILEASALSGHQRHGGNFSGTGSRFEKRRTFLHDAIPKPTSTAVVKLVQQVQSHGGRIRPKGITPEQMVGAILDTAEGVASR